MLLHERSLTVSSSPHVFIRIIISRVLCLYEPSHHFMTRPGLTINIKVLSFYINNCPLVERLISTFWLNPSALVLRNCILAYRLSCPALVPAPPSGSSLCKYPCQNKLTYLLCFLKLNMIFKLPLEFYVIIYSFCFMFWGLLIKICL